MKTRDAARGKWRGILVHFGLDERFLRNVHGPCPLCKGKDRFRFDDMEGDGTYFCNQCGAGTGLHLLMELRTWSFEQACKAIDGMIGNVQEEERKAEQTEAQKTNAIRRLLKEAQPLGPGTAALKYLRRRCGAVEPPILGPDLRAHPSCLHSLSKAFHPALLSVMRYPDGSGASVHRTYLTPEGLKAPVDPVRMIMPGKPINGSCVRIGPLQERIGIAEGIETAICAALAFRLPVWSAISAGGMVAWEPPPGIKAVAIFGDNDANFTGQQAAFTLARRLVHLGLEVEVHIPDQVGTDWADSFMAGVA